MAEHTATTVDCELCGESFDPSAAGGWCTNPECGEWKHEGVSASATDGDDDSSGDDVATGDPDAEPTIDAAVEASGPAVGAKSDGESTTADEDADRAVDEDAAGDEGGAVDVADEDVAQDDAEPAESGVEPEVGETGSVDVDDVDAGARDTDEGARNTDDGARDVDGHDTDADAYDTDADAYDMDADAYDTDADGADGEDVAATRAESTEDGDSESSTVDADPEDEEPTADEGAVPSDVAVECVDCGRTVSADANFCPACGGELVDPDSDAEEDGLSACPNCEADVSPSDNFCAACGEDLDAHRSSAELTACPACDAEVDPEDAFCAACGEDLDAHRRSIESAADEERHAADDEPDDVTDDADDTSTVAEGGGAEDAEASGTDAPTLELTAYGRSIEIEDGDAIGREVRSLLSAAGRPDDEAVRIHREHVRFVYEDGRYFVVDLGDNPTSLDGRALAKGDREPIESGDEIGLSDVVTLTVASGDA